MEGPPLPLTPLSTAHHIGPPWYILPHGDMKGTRKNAYQQGHGRSNPFGSSQHVDALHGTRP